ncbi:BTAD domain-containing putative transcriptional regulator [Streptomyces sp. NPDC055189]
MEARRGGTVVALSGSKIHTMLAALLMARGRVVSDSRLSALLWGCAPPPTVSAQICTYVSRLRKRLGPDIDIVRRQPGYALHAEDGFFLDVVEYERLDRLGRAALREEDHEGAGRLLRKALGLWQGTALANVTEHLSAAELPRLEDEYTTTLESRIEADLALGRHAALTSELTGLVTRFPVRERLRAQLMTALFRSGRQAEALHVFHQGRKVLAEELGIDPGSELTDIYQTVLRGEPQRSLLPSYADDVPDAAPVTLSVVPDPVAEAPAEQTEPAVPALLPPDTADFTGRDAELAEIQSLLAPSDQADRPRRVLITGMAGIGKTALAVRAAHSCVRYFPDGQLAADLCRPDGSPKDPRDVLTELLHALGDEAPAPHGGDHGLDELVRRYRTRTFGKRLLILLDNAAGGDLLGPLLPSGPRTAVLITGRTRLAVADGAHTVALGLLAPAESLDLFAAVAGGRTATADPDATSRIVQFCAGLPLAVRIAGGRLAARPHWPAARLAARLTDPRAGLAELRFGHLGLAGTLRSATGQLDGRLLGPLPALALLGDGTFTALDAAGLLAESESGAEEFLEALVDASLLDITGVNRRDQVEYHFHPLVLLYLRSLAGLVHREDLTAC